MTLWLLPGERSGSRLVKSKQESGRKSMGKSPIGKMLAEGLGELPPS